MFDYPGFDPDFPGTGVAVEGYRGERGLSTPFPRFGLTSSPSGSRGDRSKARHAPGCNPPATADPARSSHPVRRRLEHRTMKKRTSATADLVRGAISGGVAALVAVLVLFIVGGGPSGGIVNVVLAVVVGSAFGGALYWAASRRSDPD